MPLLDTLRPSHLISSMNPVFHRTHIYILSKRNSFWSKHLISFIFFWVKPQFEALICIFSPILEHQHNSRHCGTMQVAPCTLWYILSSLRCTIILLKKNLKSHINYNWPFKLKEKFPITFFLTKKLNKGYKLKSTAWTPSNVFSGKK